MADQVRHPRGWATMINDGDRARVERLLGGPDLAWLLSRIRERLTTGEDLVGLVQLRKASKYQREAVANLLDVPLKPGTSASVRLEDLDLRLRSTGAWPTGLAGAVAALTGPLEHRPTTSAIQPTLRTFPERPASVSAWAPVVDAIEKRTDADERHALLAWWRAEKGPAGCRRSETSLEGAERTAQQLAAVLEQLPADGLTLGEVAEIATGSRQALTSGALARPTMRAVRALAALSVDAAEALQDDHRVWESVGVVRDELSCSVLCVALPALPTGATGRALASWSAVSQPTVITLRHLRLDAPVWRSPGRHLGGSPAVLVVQRPAALLAVVEQCLEQDMRTPPVVAVGSRPSVAAMKVLGGLHGAGWPLSHHTSFDLDGLALSEDLIKRFGSQPLGMTAVDYVKAVDAGFARESPIPVGLETSWDIELGRSLAKLQRVVDQEAVFDRHLPQILGN